jgi:hypothetical protein
VGEDAESELALTNNSHRRSGVIQEILIPILLATYGWLPENSLPSGDFRNATNRFD